jgi:hypothetical protein
MCNIGVDPAGFLLDRGRQRLRKELSGGDVVEPLPIIGGNGSKGRLEAGALGLDAEDVVFGDTTSHQHGAAYAQKVFDKASDYS